MARINEPFDVLVVSQADIVANDKSIYENNNGTLNLTEGKLGIFNKHTGKTTDLSATPKTLNDLRFGVGLAGGKDFLISGGTATSEFVYASYQKYAAPVELAITIDPKVKFKKDTLYSFSVDFSNDRIYNTLGYNRYRRYFEYTTKKDLVDQDTNRKDVVEAFVKHINDNSDGLVEASKDGDNGNSKLKLTFKNSPKGIATTGKVTLLEGWDSTATTTENGTPAKAGQGTGKYVRELEYQAAGYRGHNYRVSTIWGLANDDIVYQAKEDKNYDLLTIGYVNKVNTSGFRGDVPYTVVLALQTDTAAKDNPPAQNTPKAILKKAIELSNIIK